MTDEQNKPISSHPCGWAKRHSFSKAMEKTNLLPMSEAKKNGNFILAKFRDDLPSRIGPVRKDLEDLAGRWVFVFHIGVEEDGSDLGWFVVNAVTGVAPGFPDEYFDGWVPSAKTPRPRSRVVEELAVLMLANFPSVEEARAVAQALVDEAVASLETSQKVVSFDQIRGLMGSVQNGSETTVTLFQDDATRTFHVRVGKKSSHTFWGASLQEATQKAFEANHRADD